VQGRKKRENLREAKQHGWLIMSKGIKVRDNDPKQKGFVADREGGKWYNSRPRMV